jgi:outer membrane protein
MRVAIKMMVGFGAVALVLSAVPVHAQAAAPAGQAQTQKPPAQPPAQPPATPPSTQTPAPAPAAPGTPPRPFPEGAKIAFVSVQAIASNSVEGKAATAKLDEFTKKKTAELGEKNKQLQGMQTKLQQGGSVLNDQARGQLEKDIEKLNREIQFFQQDAQSDRNELQNQLQVDFQEKLNPVLESVAKEKGLHAIMDWQGAGLAWADPGLDLTGEVIKRFDAAAAKTPVKK